MDEYQQQQATGNLPERVANHDRLWTPWRMRYITGGARENGCIFCNRRDAEDDVAALILYRGQHSFVIMNLFPYNTGHVMIVPNLHTDTLEGLPPESIVEMAELVPRVTAALHRVLACDGFNLGLNIGAIAGAGVADHLHQHVVPRWRGDANFMPILASTMVMPELIPATYAKTRAELERELLGVQHVTVVILSDDDGVILLRDGALPTTSATEHEPLWRSALDLAMDVAATVEFVGWAGPRSSGAANQPAAFVVRAQGIRLKQRWSRAAVSEILANGRAEIVETTHRALDLITS